MLVLSVVFRIYSERAFSGLKRVKTCLRSVIIQHRLSSMSFLNIENDKLYLIDLNEAIYKLAAKKRKMNVVLLNFIKNS